MSNDILVKIGADISDFSKKIGETQKSLSEIGKIRQTGGGLTVGKLAVSLGLVAAAAKGISMVKNSISSAFGRIDTMESFERVMSTITGSTEETNKALDRTREAVTGTAYGLDVAAKGVQDFVTRGVSVDKATQRIEAWGDAVAFYGEGSNEQLSGVMDALAKMSTKGKVGMDQLNRLFDAGIDAVGMYAKATGKNAGDVQDALSKGNISAEEFIDTVTVAMMEGTNGVVKIAGAAKEAGASWGGSFDNMKAAVTRGVVSIIGSIDKMLKDNGLPDMRAMVATFGRKFEEILKLAAEKIPELVEKVKSVKEALEPWMPLIQTLAIVIGTFVATIATLNSVIKVAQGVWAALNFVMGANPIVLVIAAIVALIAAFVLAYQNIEWFRDMVDAAWAWITDVFGTALGWIQDIVVKVMEQVSAFIGEILTKIRDFWAKNGEQIKALVKMSFGVVWELIKGVLNNIKALFQVVWPIISGVVQYAWGLIKMYVRMGIDLVLGIINTVLALLRGDWEGAWNSIKETVQKIWDNIVQFFRDVDLVQIGKDIINGLITGIGSMINGVKNAVKNIGKKVKDTFTSFFSIKSPSRLMMSLSKHIPGGAIKGMESMRSKVAAATERLSEAMTPEVPQLSMSYATPNGSFLSLGGALDGTIDVSASENNRLLAGIYDELRKQKQMIIEMDKREVGRLVAPTVSEEMNGQSAQATRGRGQRRI